MPHEIFENQVMLSSRDDHRQLTFLHSGLVSYEVLHLRFPFQLIESTLIHVDN